MESIDRAFSVVTEKGKWEETKTKGHKGGHWIRLSILIVRYIDLHAFGAYQTTAVDFGVHSMHLHEISNMGASWSAVCCPLFVFKVRKEFPSEQLGSCSLARLLLLQILFVSLDLEIKTVYIYIYIFNVRFQGKAGPPQVHVSTPLQGWIGSLAARGPFWQFLVIACYR